MAVSLDPRTGSASQDRLEFETLLSDISADLIAAPVERLDVTIEAALDRVRTFFRAARCGLMSVSADQQLVRVTHASYAEGVSRVSGDINLVHLFPWARQKLLVERMPAIVSRMSDLPPEADVDRASWAQMATRSNLAVPIQVGHLVGHLIAIHVVDEERVWPDAYVPRLRLLGEMLVDALERKQAFVALRASEDRLERAAAAAGCGLWELDVSSGSI